MRTETLSTIANLIDLKRSLQPNQAETIQTAVTCLHQQEARLDRYRGVMPSTMLFALDICQAFPHDIIGQVRAAMDFDDGGLAEQV